MRIQDGFRATAQAVRGRLEQGAGKDPALDSKVAHILSELRLA
jgi:hypothetical protein